MDNTLSDFRPQEYTIVASCEACEHFSRIPTDPKRTAGKVKNSLRCSICGRRGVEIRGIPVLLAA